MRRRSRVRVRQRGQARMRRCRSQAGFPPSIAIAIAIARPFSVATISIPIAARALQRNCCCLGSRAIGIQEADALSMLVAIPVGGEGIDTILECASHPHILLVHQ